MMIIFVLLIREIGHCLKIVGGEAGMVTPV